MEKIQKYYDNTEKFEPNQNIKKIINMKNEKGIAIDLGCGAGRDTVFLIKNNWNVIAIDRENVEERISKNLNEEELTRFKFEKQELEDLELPKNNLVVANSSLPFCNKNKFYEMWDKVVESILPNRIFCRNFLWHK